jgi:hypothetical protein
MEQTKAREANASHQQGITMNDLENSAGCQHLIEQTIPDGGRRATFVLGQLVGLRSNALLAEQNKVARSCARGALSISRKDRS